MSRYKIEEIVSSSSCLEYAFLKWVLSPATVPGIEEWITPQAEIDIDDRRYRVDYKLNGSDMDIAVELDGFTFHSNRNAFTYDRFRQNDLQMHGLIIIRFSYDAIRIETKRCVNQLSTLLKGDYRLSSYVDPSPIIEIPEMNPDPLHSLSQPQMITHIIDNYFDEVRTKINRKTLRRCQVEAFEALANYYGKGGRRAACVMSVGAGKTALAIASALAFTKERALIVTPGNVIKGTFANALDDTNPKNVLYALCNGPLIPGNKPPLHMILDSDAGTIKNISREHLLSANIIVTNFHSLGTGENPGDILSKLNPKDIDFIVVDEAHIAAADSYQRLFSHFSGSRLFLMSACFQRLDGKPIEADVVYQYRLIDSIADGHGKNLRVHRFAPTAEDTIYEIVWPDGIREEITGREAILDLLNDEKRLARVTALSDEPIRQLMREVRSLLDKHKKILSPIKPRVLFSALGKNHAQQISNIANEYGIPSDYLHHTLSRSRIKRVRQRYESDSGDLQGIVHLKMLGQGYDFPPITIVVPLRPYGSFSEFYQFIGRGIRVISQEALSGKAESSDQFLDIVYHADLGIDEHLETIYIENDMDSSIVTEITEKTSAAIDSSNVSITADEETTEYPKAFVVFQEGDIQEQVIYDEERVELRKREREQESLVQRYASYAESTKEPITFHKFVEITQLLKDRQ